MISAGHPRAQAVAAAYANARRHPRRASGGIVGYDDGGDVVADPYGTDETSARSANVFNQSQLQRYDQMSPEQLQAMAMVLGTGSPQGQMVNRVLQQKRFLPNVNGPGPNVPSPAKRGGRTYAEGGALDPATSLTALSNSHQITQEMLDQGGMQNTKIPYSRNLNTTNRLRDELSQKGLKGFAAGGAVGYLEGVTGGRTDVLHIQPPGGSYVIPADVMAGLGEGNSRNGAEILNRAFHMGPYGIGIPQGQAYRAPMPRAPMMQGPFEAGPPSAVKRGGKTDHEKGVGEPTPIIAAAGEFIIPPHVVRAIGGGDIAKGHDILDKWVVTKRREYAHKMLKLKPPKKR